MSLTIEQQPYEITPVNQKLMVIVSSDNVGLPDFRFIFKIDGAYEIYVQPNPEGIGMLDLAPLFKHKLSHSPAIHSNVDCGFDHSAMYQIDCRIYEGYNDGTGFAQHNAPVDIDSIGIFQASYQISKGYRRNPNLDYAMDSTTSNLLTARIPSTHQWIGVPNYDSDAVYIPARWKDYGVINYIADTSHIANSILEFVFNVFDSAGNFIYTFSMLPVQMDYEMGYVPVYPKNLVDYYTFYFTNTWSSYEVYGITDGNEQVTRKYVFYQVPDDCRYETIRMQWSNNVGGVDYFNFTKKSEETLNVERKRMRKVIGSYGTSEFGFSPSDRQNQETEIIAEKLLVITSDWISEGEFFLLKDMVASNDVNIINEDGSITPMMVEDSSYVIRKTRDGGVYNVTFNLKYSQEYLV
jgi:hypothetical protein